MNEKQKKWLRIMCSVLDMYLKIVFPAKDKNWFAVSGFIEVVTTVCKGFEDEVRSALFEITTKWELKQKNE